MASVDDVLVRGDLDAAIAFFAAARQEPVDARDPQAPPRGAPPLDFSRYRARRIRQRLLALLDRMVVAIERRDLGAVWEVLDESDACRCFPPGVRDEALLIAGMPATSLRAPVGLYRYYHMLQQLGDESGEMVGDPDQLRIALEDVGAPVREADVSVRGRSADGDPGGVGRGDARKKRRANGAAFPAVDDQLPR